MTPLTRVTSPAVVLPRDNIDTDMIIRIERLVLVPRRELGAYAFEMLRFLPDGSEDPDCPLNRPEFQSAEILVSGRNFGCGSSREAAVWALAGRGFRVIVAAGFGDIFRQNCLKNGILPVELSATDHAALTESLAAAPLGDVAVDLEAQTLSGPGGLTLSFSIGAFERDRLLAGTDEITATLQHRDAILAHLAEWQASHPWVALDPGRLAALGARQDH